LDVVAGAAIVVIVVAVVSSTPSLRTGLVFILASTIVGRCGRGVATAGCGVATAAAVSATGSGHD